MPKKQTTAMSAPAETATPTADGPALPPAAQIVLALMDVENATTAAGLAERAGLARSTVTKALAVLLDQGLAVRQEGGHEGARRIADRWFAAPGATPPPAAEDDQAKAQPDADVEPATPNSADGWSDEAAPDDEPCAEPPAPEAGPTAEPGAAGPEAADAGAVGAVPDGEASGDGPAAEPTEAVDPGTAEAPAADPEVAPSGAVDGQSPDQAVAGAEPDPAPAASDAEDAAPRLGKGALRAMVEAHLRENPDREWTPTAISKVLGKSAGAINNACVKLAETGSVAILPDKPVRFRWNGAAS
jgi:hypothetical protein